MKITRESLSELEKDAARYRWWRTFFEPDSEAMPDAVCAVATPDELDAAIDAAMTKEEA